MYKKLTAPEYHLILQTVELNDGIYIKYKSSKAAHCDTCNVSTAGYQDTIESLIRNMMDIKTRDELNVLYRDSIIGTLLPNIPRYRKCLITQPAEDVHVPIGTVIVPGEIKITVLNVA